ncbi:putative bifunctional diguanylate cyclase/phosphodiesterase [Actinoplanes sp. NPDC051494]|uniref:putative bifunctional diguanylate cyclase/phosphodiesterase n=1 Tax=Actinoplanes sp. NPDC051494 TaxID=3363907 RepID=UPI0037982187
MGVRLSDEAFRSRHNALRVVLWAQFPILALVAWWHGPHMDAAPAAELAARIVQAVLVVCALGSLIIRNRRAAAVTVSLGLLLSAAALTEVGGGRTDLHFAFFLMVGLISLYQDGLPLALAVVLVIAHHLVMGMLDPSMLYSDHGADQEWIQLAALHAGFVLGCCAVQIVYWRFAARAQAETDAVRGAAERALRAGAERYESLVQDGSDIVTVVDRAGRVVSVSAAVERIMGFRPDDLTGTRYPDLIHPDDRHRYRDGDPDDYRAEVRLRHADNTWHWHDLAVRDLTDRPAVAGLVINHRDVTERRAFQDQLQHEATHDALTGLVNRGELIRTLAARLTLGDDLAVLYLDLDGFKKVNDTYGHEAGDALLVAVGRALHRCVLGSDTVGRLGGDEFAVVLTRITTVDDAVAVATRILAELALPVEVNGRDLQPRASIGIALAIGEAVGTDALLHRADTAMYHAKRDRTANWRLYVDGLHDPDNAAATLEDDLRDAVERDQLHLLYQPVVALETGELVGVEALVRWDHPTHGLLPPERFLRLAEESGLIDEIGRRVLNRACRQVRRWQRRMSAAGRLSLSVNLSPRQLEHDGTVADVLAALRETGFDPGDLTLDVAETAGAATPRLGVLRDLGVRVALDDFGSGNSSLHQLTNRPVDALKLDRRYVADLDGTGGGSAVAEAVVRLGHLLHLDTVAEGVENAAQAAELTLLGCRTAQGHHFAYPLTPDEVGELLDSVPAGTRPRLPVPLTSANPAAAAREPFRAG